MIAYCPVDPAHKTFLTTAVVLEEWVVDETGDFVDNKGYLETVDEPNSDNAWWCYDCYAPALFKTH